MGMVGRLENRLERRKSLWFHDYRDRQTTEDGPLASARVDNNENSYGDSRKHRIRYSDMLLEWNCELDHWIMGKETWFLLRIRHRICVVLIEILCYF